MRAQGVVSSGVASGDYHYDAGIPGGFHGLAKRINRVAFVDLAA
jgi:hypothetical protein